MWEKTAEELLRAPLALLPLTPLTNVSAVDLPGVVQRMEERIEAEAPAEERGLLWTTTWLLLGLKYEPEFARDLLKGVMAMKESSTYQYTLEEGRVEGREQGKVAEARHMLSLMGSKRFGAPDAQAQDTLTRITSQQQLEQLAVKLFEVESWQELLA